MKARIAVSGSSHAGDPGSGGAWSMPMTAVLLVADGNKESMEAGTLCAMPRIPVDDPADPRLAAYQQLRQQNPLRSGGRFIAEGAKVAKRLIASRYPVESLLVVPEEVEEFESLV